MRFSILSETIAPSEILKIGSQVKEMALEGNTVYNFTIGDFDPAVFPIPQGLEDSIVSAYRDHLTGYPLAEGNLDLRRSIKKYVREFQGLDYEEHEILVGSGGRPLIFSVFLALCDPGDQIIYPVPSWNNNYYAHFVTGDPVMIETKEANHFMPLASEIEPFIKTARLLALCSPQNPAGTIFTREELQKICDLVVAENIRRGDHQKRLFILFDQMYSQLVYGTSRHYTPVEVSRGVRPYTILVDAISKSFAATGVRVGWCLGPAELISKMKTLMTHIGAWAPMPEQKGLAGYFQRTGEIRIFLNRFKQQLYERLQYLYEGIIRLKNEGYPVDAIAPEGAIYLSLKIDLLNRGDQHGAVLKSEQEVTRFLLSQAGLAIIPFSAFGSTKNDAWYRLSVGTCKTGEMDSILGGLRHALDNFTGPLCVHESSVGNHS